MSNYALTQTIVTGSDPRALPEFSAIREEINKANHPSQPELNWKLVESLALSIFKANGVDCIPPPTIRWRVPVIRGWQGSAKARNCWLR